MNVPNVNNFIYVDAKNIQEKKYGRKEPMTCFTKSLFVRDYYTKSEWSGRVIVIISY